MKDNIRDLLVKTLPGTTPPHTRVLCFHDIPEPRKLEEKLFRLQNDFQILPLHELVNEDQRSSVSITFDDGYESWYDKVVPVLEKLNVPATFFVNSGILDQKGTAAIKYAKINLRREDTDISPLTTETLKKLAAHPLCTIGGHTRDHYLFDKDTPNHIVKEQIQEDKNRLEAIISEKMDFFAYPFGQLQNATKQVRKVVEESGYQYAFTIQPGNVNIAHNRYLLPRDSLLLDQPYEVWKNWLTGSYDTLAKLKIKVYDLLGVEYR